MSDDAKPWATRSIARMLLEAQRRLNEQTTEEVRREGIPRAPVVKREGTDNG